MLLADLSPQWMAGHDVVPRPQATRLRFECPCGAGHLLSITSPPWEFTGDDFSTLTVRPSVQVVGDQQCNQHFFITDGAIVGI